VEGRHRRDGDADPGRKGYEVGYAVKLFGGICIVIGAIAATLQIIDFWQRRATVPPSPSEPRSAVKEELPEPARHGSEQARGNAAAAETTRSPVTDVRASEPAAAHLESLINRRAVPAGRVRVMAIALDGDSADVESLEAALVQGLSSPELRLVTGFFTPAFRERGLLRAVYDGDTEILTKSGALAAVDRILIGRVERACRERGQLDSDLVTCDVGLHFKIIDRSGAIASAGHVAVAGAGFSEDAARERAIEMLVQQHGARVISPE